MQHAFSLSLHIIVLFLFFFFLVRLFYRIRDKKESTANDETMKKISQSSFILKKLGINREDYYYDRFYFYQVREQYTNKIPLSKIIRVSPDIIKINGRRKWSVRYIAHDAEKEVTFVHNFTLFNRNFAGFLSAVKEANPNADVKVLTIFSF